MAEYRIVTDCNADFVPGYVAENNIIELEMTYTIEDKTYFCNDPALSRPAFYEMMRHGKMPITAQINVESAKETLRPYLAQGVDLLCLIFSSALSGSYNSVRIACEELQEEFPERRMIVLDTLSASAGEGMLVSYAVDYQAAGLSIEENAQKMREEIPNQAHLFTVNDLYHLHRGGRVSAASAVVGTMLSIKPVLHVDDHGKLIPIGKVRGRRASLLALVDNMEKQIDQEHCDRFAISHGDCVEDAQFVADEVSRRFKIKKYSISYIGPTVGAHSGPGTVALFFKGIKR